MDNYPSKSPVEIGGADILMKDGPGEGFVQGQGALAQARSAYVRLLEDSLKQIVERLSSLEEVQRVSLFGSYAQGRADLFTDVDLLVVMETDKPFVERLRALYSLLALPVDLDLLCYTPSEFEALKERPFLKWALREEMVLHEKRRP